MQITIVATDKELEGLITTLKNLEALAETLTEEMAELREMMRKETDGS
jgi:prefoldin subunit 5